MDKPDEASCTENKEALAAWQCRCITSDYISRLPHRTAPGPLSLPRFHPFFPAFVFFAFLTVRERERAWIRG